MPDIGGNACYEVARGQFEEVLLKTPLKDLIGAKIFYVASDFCDENGKQYYSYGADDEMSLGTIKELIYNEETGETFVSVTGCEFHEGNGYKSLHDTVFKLHGQPETSLGVYIMRDYSPTTEFASDEEANFETKIREYVEQTAQEVANDVKAGKVKPYVVGGIAFLLLYKILK